MSAKQHSKKSDSQTNSPAACAAFSTEEKKGNYRSGSTPPALQKAMTMVHRNDYAGAVNLLRAAGRDIVVRNALGVCLMRIGQADEAVEIFRQFVLVSGTVYERPEVSNACKRNFATALLMKGLPGGALEILATTHEPDHPMALPLYRAIKKWEKNLSWLRRLDWKLSRVEPSKCHVPIDFEPGEFDFEITRQNHDDSERPDFKLAL